MSRLTLEEYLNERINNVNTYIEFNERKGDKDFFAYKELELYQMAEKYMKLTNELGCPLDVVFKALKEGSIEDENGGIQIVGITIGGDGELYLHAINGDLYLLKDYGKTWWICENGEN